ncbi:hypothetical protein [Oricola thermophila]|uniref:Uncharacterized protein n=1 Tax=Oricola thermophila TaxID=2742145 RepID=A0A6N1VEU3_9HYPH|nr:hypothetical protein [Oricola thermophila]QKV19476.1 hypothetical protein HTY61_13935 [Oricola thermophila]
MTLDKLRAEILNEWDSISAAEICVQILEYFENLPPKELNFLTFRTLRTAANRDSIDDELLFAINILSNSNPPLLELHTLFIDENDEEFEIDPKEIGEAKKTGIFIHPDTGEPVNDYENYIIPFFSPTKRLIAELK